MTFRVEICSLFGAKNRDFLLYKLFRLWDNFAAVEYIGAKKTWAFKTL